MEKLLGNDPVGFRYVGDAGEVEEDEGNSGEDVEVEVLKSGEEALDEIKREWELLKRKAEAREQGAEKSADGKESEILFLRWKNK